jgi:protein-disulfide isomerase
MRCGTNKLLFDNTHFYLLLSTNFMDQPAKKNTNTILVVLLVGAAFVIGMLWQQNQTLTKGSGSGQVAGEASGQAVSPLAVDKLKVYAEDLKLDKNKFNKCLDDGKYTDQISSDITYGGTVNVAGTPAFFINGRFVGGAFPFEWFKEIIDKEIAGTGSDDITQYSKNLQDVAGQGGFDPKKKTIEVKSIDPAIGPENAKVTIVEFSDFECPYCAQVYPTVKQILSTYGNDVRLIYKQFPLNSIHPNAQKAAEASLCAHEQGKFFEYHDKLFESQKQG